MPVAVDSPAVRTVTSASRRLLPTTVEDSRYTLVTGTPASTASCALIAVSWDAKAVAVRLNSRVSRMSRPYLHLYPASHRQWACRLDSAGLCVWTGHTSWLSPAQYELTGQAAQVCVLTVRLPA